MARSDFRVGDRYSVCRTTLRSILSLAAGAGIALVAFSYRSNVYSQHPTLWVQLPAMAPLTLAIFWNLINTIYICAKKHPIHPGWNVGAHLIFTGWTLVYTGILLASTIIAQTVAGLLQHANQNLAVTTGSLATNYQFRETFLQGQPGDPSDYASGHDYTYYSYDDGKSSSVRVPTSPDYSCPNFDSCTEQDAWVRAWQQSSTVLLGATVCFFIVTLVHFTLFVWACIDTHRRRRGEPAYGRTPRAPDAMDEAFTLAPMGKPSFQSHGRSISDIPMPPQAPLLRVDPAPYAHARGCSLNNASPSLEPIRSHEGDVYVPYRDGRSVDLGRPDHGERPDQTSGGRERSVSGSSLEPYDAGTAAPPYGRTEYRPPHQRTVSEISIGDEAAFQVRKTDGYNAV